jgi:hypothetical protein
MTPITHAILPLVLGYWWVPKRAYRPILSASACIALSGALPDLLDPHITLEARYNSWSHTVIAFLIFSSFVMALGLFTGLRRYSRIGLICIFGYGLHIVCDVISGGGRPFSPFSRKIYGGDIIPSWSWGASDIALLFCLYLIFRWIPLRKAYCERLRNQTPLTPPKTIQK